METLNSNQLTKMSIEDIRENAEKVFHLIQLSKAKEEALNGEFVDGRKAFEELENE